MAVIAAPQTSDHSASAPRRLLYIDNLRWALITLVVTGHLAITYGGEGQWYYQETGTVSDAFTIVTLPLAAILYASLLGLFAFIAGYFTPRAFDRKGTAGFLLDRVKRLLIPLLVYEFILNPIINYIRDVHERSFQGSLWQFFGLWFSPLKSFGDGPVWFLEMLLIFSLLYTAWRVVSGGLATRVSGRTAKPLPGNGMIALFAAGLGLVTFGVRIWAPVGTWYEPWHQELAHYPSYLAMFVVGTLAFREDWLTRFPDRQARLWRWLAPAVVVALLGVLIAAGALSGTLDERAAGGFNWLSLAYSMWEAWTCVVVNIVILVWFRARFNHQGPLQKELADSAFGVYVLHPAVIVPLAIALSGIEMNLSLKFLWVTPLALAICYALVVLLRRVPGLRAFL